MSGPSPRRRERGTVLVLAAIIGLVVMSLWGLAWQGTHDAIRTERFVRLRAERDATVARALAQAADWLRDGPPPRSGWACLFSTGEDEQSVSCTAVFTRGKAADVWEIEVHPSTPAELRQLTPAPRRTPQ